MMKEDAELFYFATHSVEDAERIGYSDYSYWGFVMHNFLKKKGAVCMLILFLGVVAFSFVALEIGRYDYADLHINADIAFTKPNAEYWFGTDNLGRDYWCQVWYAAQISIRLALIVVAGESILGVSIGCLWGYVRSLDRFFTEFYNIINNIPTIIYMTLIAMVVGRSFTTMAATMISVGWLGMARNVRNLVMIYRDREYNLASRCLGTPIWRIIVKNIFPHLVSAVILRMAISIPQTIAQESTLSYLGLGLGLDTPSLGILLRNARADFINRPYLLIFPALIVSIVTFTFYLVGNAFSDAADPKNHR